MTTFMDTELTPTAILSRRQGEILAELMKDGASNAAIGKRLFLTEDTVKTHIRAILNKTGCATRTQLIVAVFRGELKIIRPRVG